MFRIPILIIMLLVIVGSSRADEGDWRIYASYASHDKAVQTGSLTYVMCDGGLFSYDREDQSVQTYDKTNILNDHGIFDIAACQTTGTIVVLYKNGNIDFIEKNGEVYNLSELKNKTISDKTLNELRVFGSNAYISSNAGIIVIDVKKKYFINLYNINKKVTSCIVKDGAIYAKTTDNIYKGTLTDNLLDASNWQPIGSSTAEADFASQAATEKEASDKLLKTTESIKPDGPVRNYSYRLNMQGDRLLIAGGNFYYTGEEYPGTIICYEKGAWSAFDEKEAINLVGEKAYRNVTDIVQDKDDPSHHWVGTRRSGLYEFKDGKLKHYYGYDNSPICSILPDNTHPEWYTRITALQQDSEGNLWMCNNECDTIIRIITPAGKWHSIYYPEIKGFPTFDQTMFDQRGWAWIVQRRTTENHIAGLMVINTNGTLNKTSDDKHRYLTSFSNQDGTAYTPNLYYCVKEDLNGAIWIGTRDGVFVSYDPENVFDNSFRLTQVKVPRNDGSNLADYLLSSVATTCITIDGGNRKWIGTADDGVYLVSADGTETIEHFTSENSPLINNSINDIAINGTTGEVFFATYAGLCSYRGNATDPVSSMSKNTLRVYPNPVEPDYTGDIRIMGLMSGSVVKIVNAAGRLVAEGESVGGEFTWNGCTKGGRRATSGIYFVLATDSEGKNGACSKFLFVTK